MKKFFKWLFDANSARSKVSSLAALLVFGLLAGVLLTGVIAPIAIGVNQLKDSADSVIDDIAIDGYSGVMSSRTTMYANDGTTVLAKFYAQDRIVVTLDQISKNLQNAIIAREDKRFYEHSGLDPLGMLRGLVKTSTAGEDGEKQGGSTITQQYIKNLLIDNAMQSDDPISAFHAKEQTLYRKIKEAKYAFDVESKLSKDQILEGYLNVAPFGPNTYGAQASALRYFSKDAKDLSVPEAALIASIAKSPTMYDPLTYPETAKEQRDIVLSLMLDQGYITKDEYDQYAALSIEEMLHPSVVPVGCQTAGNAAFFCDYVVNTILNNRRYGSTKADRKRFLYQGGISVYTTLDKRFQDQAQATVDSTVPVDDQPLHLEDALVTIEPGTGKVLAMAQNRPYNPAQTDQNALDTAINYSVGSNEGGSSGFSPGSTIKVVTVADWLKNGHTLNESIAGKVKYPFVYTDFACSQPAGVYSPKNSNGGVGIASPISSFNQSLNVPMIMMAAIDGLCSWSQTAKDMGVVDQLKGDITDSRNLIPPITIGAINTTPLTMAEVYATVASGGMHCSAVPITKIANEAGEEFPISDGNCKQVLDKDVANTTFYAMKTNISSGIARPAGIAGRDVGAKTGTSEESKHLWTASCVVQVCTVMWVGNAQFDIPLAGVKINGKYAATWYGTTLVAPALGTYMKNALANANIPNIPIPQPNGKMMGSGTPDVTQSASTDPASSTAGPTTTQTQPTTSGTTNPNPGDSPSQSSRPRTGN